MRARVRRSRQRLVVAAGDHDDDGLLRWYGDLSGHHGGEGHAGAGLREHAGLLPEQAARLENLGVADHTGRTPFSRATAKAISPIVAAPSVSAATPPTAISTGLARGERLGQRGAQLGLDGLHPDRRAGQRGRDARVEASATAAEHDQRRLRHLLGDLEPHGAGAGHRLEGVVGMDLRQPLRVRRTRCTGRARP